MALLAVQAINNGTAPSPPGTGLAPTYAAATVGGDTAPVRNARTFLHFKNTGTQKTVTIDRIQPCSNGVDHNSVITVPATTGDIMVGPFPADQFGDPAAITYAPDATGLTVACLQL